MKGLLPLILGILGTFAFSWVGLTMIPNAQIGHLDPQMDEDGNDPYPAPKSGLAERGSRVYAANGCVYCHSQQVRADYAASDIERKWGDRRSAPRDYLFERPVMLGKSRMGPDLSNIGARAPAEEPEAPPAATAAASPAPSTTAATAPTADANAAPAAAPASSSAAVVDAAPASSPAAPAASPAVAIPAPTEEIAATTTSGEPLPYSAAWHHLHFYNPRSIAQHSNMPPYRFLYEKRRIGGQVSADALKLTGEDAPPEGWEIVPSYDAKALVAYLMSLNQSHPLNEVKTAAAVSAPATEGAAK